MRAVSVFLLIAIAYFLFSLVGCQSVQQPVAASKPAPIDVKLPWKNEAWTTFLVSEISKSKIPDSAAKDAKNFCPKYPGLSRNEKVVVLSHLVVRMAERESGWKPETTFVECSKSKDKYGKSARYFPERGEYCIPGHKLDGGVAISRGLLQISLQSAQSYGCEFKTPADLQDPIGNLKCGVKILERWVSRDQMLMGTKENFKSGCGRYWSVCRTTSGSYEKIRRYVAQAPGCS